METKQLKILSLVHVVAGILITSLVFLDFTHSIVINLIYPNGIENTEQIIFWISIFGPTLASWGLLFFLAVKNYEVSPTKESFKLMIYSLLIWAPLDSLLCLYNGIYIGALGNAIILMLFLYLLFKIRPLAKK